MTKEDLIAMAKAAGFDVTEGEAKWMRDPNDFNLRISVEEYEVGNAIAMFASLVMEKCAEKLEAMAAECPPGDNDADALNAGAAAIRAMGERT